MFVDVFSHKIYYEAYGAEHRNTLLYLHGGPGASCLDFVNQAKALGEKIRVILSGFSAQMQSARMKITAWSTRWRCWRKCGNPLA